MQTKKLLWHRLEHSLSPIYCYKLVIIYMQNTTKSLCKFPLTLVSDKPNDGWWILSKIYRLTKPPLVILLVT